MREQTLSIDIENSYLLDYIENGINKALPLIDGVSARTNSSSRSYLAIAVQDVFARQINNLVRMLLLDVLAIGYKNIYLLSNMSIAKKNFVSNTLINSMSIFDCTADKQYIVEQLEGSNDINIDGYYNFRMKALKYKWDEIIQLVNDNGAILTDIDVLSEFLLYMIEGLPRVINNLSVVLDDKSYYMFDSKNNILSNCYLPIQSCTVEESVMLDIIMNKPKKLTIFCDKYDCSQPFVDMCNYLFDVNFVKNS